jgi:hypothetical protein
MCLHAAVFLWVTTRSVMKMAVDWDIAPWSLEDSDQRFIEAYCSL